MPTPWSNGSACKSSEPNEKSEPLERTAQLGMNVTSLYELAEGRRGRTSAVRFARSGAAYRSGCERALRRRTKRSALYSCHGGRLDTQGHSPLLRIRFAQGHRRPAAHGDLTESFVPSFREPFLDNSRSERPLGQPRRARRLRWFSSHRLSRWGRRQME
jgi:hypothetical protein